MRNTVTTTKFKRDFEKLMKDSIPFRKNKAKFDDYVNKLKNGESLPAEADNHPLSKASPKKYKGCWDFHVIPDICVIYRMTKDTIELIRIGQHNNLGLTENFEN